MADRGARHSDAGPPPVEPSELFAPELRRDPYPYYARLRELGPVVVRGHPEVWLISRHRDVAAVLRDSARFSSRGGSGHTPTIVELDGGAHRRLRAKLAEAFTAESVDALTPRIRELASKLAESAVSSGTFDLMSAFATPLPMKVITDMLGLLVDRLDDLERWSGAILASTALSLDDEERRRLGTINQESLEFFAAHVERPDRLPPGSALRHWLSRRDHELRLEKAEAIQVCRFLMVGGQVTTAYLLGNAVLALIRNRQTLAAVRTEPALIPAAVEEAMRYDPPVQYVKRLTTAPVMLDGRTIPEGARVLALLGAANRDPEVFSEPDRFDIARPAGNHLAFGLGPHYCLGSRLARRETRVALEELLASCRSLRLAQPVDSLCYSLRTPELRGLEELRLAAS